MFPPMLVPPVVIHTVFSTLFIFYLVKLNTKAAPVADDRPALAGLLTPRRGRPHRQSINVTSVPATAGRRARMTHDRGGWQAGDAYRAVWPSPSCGAVMHRRRSGDPDAMRLAQGTRLGHYEILAPLGKGGMGEVYLAQDSRLDRRVALKVLPGAVDAGDDRLTRFMREAKAASALNHPNIITISTSAKPRAHTSSPTNTSTAMTLGAYASSAAVSLTATLDIALQVVSALVEAHGAGIVHRDIKPDNVMVRPSGLVKLLDFGIARLAGPAAPNPDVSTLAEAKTLEGLLIGTPQSMSPEQARGPASITRATSSALAWCCTNCSRASRRSRAAPSGRPRRGAHARTRTPRDAPPALARRRRQGARERQGAALRDRGGLVVRLAGCEGRTVQPGRRARNAARATGEQTRGAGLPPPPS